MKSWQAPPRSVWTIVLGGGASTRFGRLKQFADLNGRSLLDWAVAVARHCCHGLVVVVPQGYRFDETAADVVVSGGSTRSGSVRAGLAAVPRDAEVIVIHDAAHPLAGPNLFTAVVDAVRSGADGAVPGLSVREAVRVVRDGWMLGDLERSMIVLVQMPQAYKASILRRAHADAPEVVEDSLLVRRLGGRVRVVAGDPVNIHVATTADLEVVSAIARDRQ